MSEANLPSQQRQAFIDALVEVYKRHGLSLGHEDSHGAFIIEDYSEVNVHWLNQALPWTKDVKRRFIGGNDE